MKSKLHYIQINYVKISLHYSASLTAEKLTAIIGMNLILFLIVAANKI